MEWKIQSNIESVNNSVIAGPETEELRESTKSTSLHCLNASVGTLSFFPKQQEKIKEIFQSIKQKERKIFISRREFRD